MPNIPISDPNKGLWVPKGWGGEHWIANDEEHNYCAKRLFVLAGKCFSYHYHEIKHETFYVISGRGSLLYAPHDDEARFRGMLENARERPMVPGDVIIIPPSSPHRVIAHEDLWIFEASTFDRDEDSIRLVKGD
jgi:quercetin dioxygenase-like cupin family protein